jgi:hypothetical protein
MGGTPSPNNPGQPAPNETHTEAEAEEAAGDASESAFDSDSEVPGGDRRDSRPEPVEQALGAEAHPAEPVTRDPDDQQ